MVSSPPHHQVRLDKTDNQHWPWAPFFSQYDFMRDEARTTSSRFDSGLGVKPVRRATIYNLGVAHTRPRRRIRQDTHQYETNHPGTVSYIPVHGTTVSVQLIHVPIIRVISYVLLDKTPTQKSTPA